MAKQAKKELFRLLQGLLKQAGHVMRIEPAKVRKVILVGVLTTCCVTLALPALAAPPALYFRWQKAKAPAVRDCVRQAYTVMRELKLSRVKKSENWVAGSTANSNASILCLGTRRGITAVIMVASKNYDQARTLGSRLSKALSKKETVRFD